MLQLQHASGLPTVRATGSASPAVGDPVTAVGNALGQPGPLAVVTGVVDGLDQTITVSDPSDGSQQQLSGLIQTDAPLQPGDSGGPLLDASGVVIGMDTAASSPGRYQRSAPEGFAIPMTKAMAVAREMQAGRSSATVHIGPAAFLGVQLISVDEASSAFPSGYQAPAAAGAVVATVQAKAPAATAGLTAGDEIVSFDGHTVDSPSALRPLMASHHPGDRVAVGWLDPSGHRHQAVVTLAAGPPQ